MQKTDVAWRPSEAVLQEANWTRFIAHCGLPDYAALATRASADPERFWRALADWLQFRFRRPPRRMLDLADGLAHPRWCIGGTTNLYDSAVTAALERDPGRLAVVWEGESGEERRCSYAELDREAADLAAGLHGLGLGPGDVVGVYLPMLPETAAAFMACARLGCITLPLFSGFGAEAVAQRLGLGGARAVITGDGTRRRGASVAMKPVVDAALAGNTEVRHVVVLRHAGLDVPMHAPGDVWWHELTAAGEAPPVLEVPAEQPVLLMAFTRFHGHCYAAEAAAWNAASFCSGVR